MSALTLGLIAALCWGFHDICVRFLSQKTPISACIVTVLTTGLLFHLGVMAVRDGFAPLPASALWSAVAAGVCFVIATFGLYAAFQRGPVRLVAPLIASYPILSVVWAVVSGEQVALFQWFAVGAIVVGVSLVAMLSEANPGGGDLGKGTARTVIYALIAAAGFAGTFALGQMATEQASELPVTLATRVVALAVSVAIVVLARRPVWPGTRALGWLIAMGIADGIALLSVLSAGGLPGAQYAAVTSSMFGLLTIVMAWAFLSERMSPAQWLGCAVAFTGVGALAL